jgi:hypothetical protein
MCTGSFPGVESGQDVTLTPHPLLVPRFEKQSRALPLLSLKAFVACKKGEAYHKKQWTNMTETVLKYKPNPNVLGRLFLSSLNRKHFLQSTFPK